jgi:hypothetical protein
LDNDGDIDIVILNSRREPTVLRNDSPRRRWLDVRLIATGANREGIGARIEVTAGDLQQTAEIHSGRGYQSHSGIRAHFGMANHPGEARLKVDWIGGGTDIWEDIPGDRTVTVIEGRSRP